MSSQHAVARLRNIRLATHTHAYVIRGNSISERCPTCRLLPRYCVCSLKTQVECEAAFCLLMSENEPLKPSNTGWLIADVVPNTYAFEWHRTMEPSAILAVLNDPQFKPYIVFPGEFADPSRVISQLPAENSAIPPLNAPNLLPPNITAPSPKPLFILLDATWSEARKIFKKSPWLNHLPVLSLQPEQISRYRLRRARREEHLCTAEVAALCLTMANQTHAANVLDAWLDVYSEHYLRAKLQQKLNLDDEVHTRMVSLRSLPRNPSAQ